MINRTRLEDLRQTVGPAFEVLLAQSIADLEALSAALDDDIRCGIPARDADTLHAIKGVALNLGLDQLAESCEAAEAAPYDASRAALARGVRVQIARGIAALRRESVTDGG